VLEDDLLDGDGVAVYSCDAIIFPFMIATPVAGEL
jgi:hypothetical protein